MHQDAPDPARTACPAAGAAALAEPPADAPLANAPLADAALAEARPADDPPGEDPPGVGPPFPHGPFLVARDGRLRPRPPAGRPSLRFQWRGLRCSAELAAIAEEPTLRLAAELGRIPYTAEDAAARRATFRLLADFQPEDFRLSLTADHRLQAERQATGDMTAIGLCGAMVRFALALDPLLDRLAEVGAAQPLPPAGEAMPG